MMPEKDTQAIAPPDPLRIEGCWDGNPEQLEEIFLKLFQQGMEPFWLVWLLQRVAKAAIAANPDNLNWQIYSYLLDQLAAFPDAHPEMFVSFAQVLALKGEVEHGIK